MKPGSRPPSGDSGLLELAYELMEAHLDTVELMGWDGELRWRAHLDYLRALVRKTEQILAQRAEAPVAARAAPRAEEAR